jgi:hypothetical protein
MKFRINLSMALIISLALTSLVLFSGCNNDDSKKCCEGYTGKMTSPRADSLVKRCHFISQDSIEAWVGRYEAYKKDLIRKQEYRTDGKDSVNAKADEMKAEMDEMSKRFLLGGSVSYNSCIIKKILCDKESIGLRVLYGIGSDSRMHIILVGIKPDYSNLYVKVGDECCPQPMNKTLGAQAGDAGGSGKGGAEYGQMP